MVFLSLDTIDNIISSLSHKKFLFCRNVTFDTTTLKLLNFSFIEHFKTCKILFVENLE